MVTAQIKKNMNGAFNKAASRVIPGGTPLMRRAARGRQEDAIDIQLGWGRADANAVDDNGWTALMHAVWNRHSGNAKKLIERGADPRTKNKAGATALDLARKRRDRAMIKMLELAVQHIDATEQREEKEWLAALHSVRFVLPRPLPRLPRLFRFG